MWAGDDEALDARLGQKPLHACAVGVKLGKKAGIVEGRPAAESERARCDALLAQPQHHRIRQLGRVGIERTAREKRAGIRLSPKVCLPFHKRDVVHVAVGAMTLQHAEEVIFQIRAKLAVEAAQLGMRAQHEGACRLAHIKDVQVSRAVHGAAPAQSTGEGEMAPSFVAIEQRGAYLA